jgi:hypothetical protein
MGSHLLLERTYNSSLTAGAASASVDTTTASLLHLGRSQHRSLTTGAASGKAETTTISSRPLRPPIKMDSTGECRLEEPSRAAETGVKEK